MVLIKRTWLFTSCAMSLSPVEITTSILFFYCLRRQSANHIIGFDVINQQQGQAHGFNNLMQGAICSRNSSGMGGRLALY